MRKFLILLSVIILNAPLFALDAGITVSSFKGGKENYIETAIFVVGRSIAQKQVDSVNSIGSVDVLLNFLQKNRLVKSEKFKIRSPRSIDPSDFADMRRFSLPDGFYDVEVALFDLNNSANATTFKTTVQLDFSENLVRQSDILLLSAAKFEPDKNAPNLHNGYKLESVPFQLYDNRFSELQFYTECYNLDKASVDSFTFSFTIDRVDTSLGTAFISQKFFQKAVSFLPQLMKIDISKMPSGTYKLSTKLILKNDDLINEREVFFQRFNLALETAGSNNIIVDSTLSVNEFVGSIENTALDYNLKAISMNVPVEDSSRFKEILAGGDMVLKRKFLYLFWIQKSAKFPEQAFDEYMFNARSADKAYASGTQYGFETDRGRIFMKYGRPTDLIFVDNEENTPPYEIWVFDKILSVQGPKGKFVFYNTDNISGNYRLLQSNFKNEINNPHWLKQLYKKVSIENLKLKPHNAEGLFNKN